MAYRLRDGSVSREHFPAHQSDFHHAEPGAGDSCSKGWGEPIDDCVTIDDLPEAARAYVRLVELALDVPVRLVGTGAAREQVLAAA